jgi:agmatine deiminase
MRTYEIAPLLILATAGAAMAQTPEGVALPRGLTADERAHVERTPLIATGAERGVAGAPTGPVVCPPEYAPCAGIIIAWEGPTSWKDILANMTVQITTRPESQGAKVWIAVDSSTEGSSTASLLDSRGADLSRVEFVVRQTDSIWMRDYGPRFIYEGGVRAIVDHTYNRPRFADNLFPDYFSSTNGYEQYQIPLVHGGGNFHLAADQDAWATELIQDENPSLSAAQIVDLWRDFQNLETELTDALPSFIDATQHIDMWMIPVSDNTIIVSDWPSQPGTTQDSVCDQFAIDAQNLGYTVVRAPAVALSGTHYTYTNAVIVNDLVLMPVYSNASIRSLNGQALSAWESALPGKTIQTIPAENIVSAAGVLHCIVKHVPANSGGEDPVASVRMPAAGEVYEPGDNVRIVWTSDDDEGVVEVDLLFSTDNGASFQPIATAIADTGAFNWTTPDLFSDETIVRVVPRDAEGNTGVADAGPITIDGEPTVCVGDFTGDNVVDGADFGVFGAAFGASVGDAVYDARADFNEDGVIDGADFGAFGAVFGSSCP